MSWVGPVIGVHDIRLATEQQLQKWLPAAVVSVARQSTFNLESVPLPKSWQVVADVTNPPADITPLVAVTSPETVQITRDQGVLHTVWQLNIMTAVRHATWRDTADLLGIYTTAIAAVVEQHGPVLPGQDEPLTVQVQNVGYRTTSITDQRSVVAGVVACHVIAHDVVRTVPVHAEPPDDPYEPAPDIPLIESTSARIYPREN